MLPKLIYEALPFFYIAVGVVTLTVVESPILFISSLLFLAAGVLVLAWRFTYRKGTARERVTTDS